LLLIKCERLAATLMQLTEADERCIDCWLQQHVNRIVGEITNDRLTTAVHCSQPQSHLTTNSALYTSSVPCMDTL